jgi:hypothetical protein
VGDFTQEEEQENETDYIERQRDQADATPAPLAEQTGENPAHVAPVGHLQGAAARHGMRHAERKLQMEAPLLAPNQAETSRDHRDSTAQDHDSQGNSDESVQREPESGQQTRPTNHLQDDAPEHPPQAFA